MAVKLIKWPSKVKFSRGPKNHTEYSTGGAEGEEVEVPQIEESQNIQDFIQDLVNLVGNEDETKQIINKNVLALPAIREGQTKYKGTHKKSGVMNNTEATQLAIKTVSEYVPTLSKERGTVVAEAFKAKNQMDALKAARQKVADGTMDIEEFQEMLTQAFEME